MNALPKKLLAADEPAPVTVYNADGESPFVLVADHAGNIMPRALAKSSGAITGGSKLGLTVGGEPTRGTRS